MTASDRIDKLEVVRYRGVEALTPAYPQLFGSGNQESFFLTIDWFRNFESTLLEAGEKARIYGVETASIPPTPVSALFTRLARRGEGFWAPMLLEALGNYYTSLQGPVSVGGQCKVAALQALADALWADRRQWDVLDLHPLDIQQSYYAALPAMLRRKGLVVQTYFCFGNWYLEVAGRSYAEYFSELSSSLKKNIPYYTRKLERDPRSRVEIITGGSGLEQALRDYDTVYGSSWKTPEPFPSFIPGFVRVAASNGWLRLGIVHVNDEAAAAQIWIVHSGTASIYKVAYDARFAKLSVGTILTAKLMQHVIDVDHVRIVDYLTGDDNYKKEWMSHRRERWGIVAFNPRRLRGAWQAMCNVGGRAMKKLVKRFDSASKARTADAKN